MSFFQDIRAKLSQPQVQAHNQLPANPQGRWVFEGTVIDMQSHQETEPDGGGLTLGGRNPMMKTLHFTDLMLETADENPANRLRIAIRCEGPMSGILNVPAAARVVGTFRGGVLIADVVLNLSSSVESVVFQKAARCFVAASVFREPWNADIALLCTYRDSRLRRTSCGEAIISCYEKYSPPLAGFCERCEPMRFVFFFAVKFVVTLIKLVWRESGLHEVERSRP